MGEGRGRTGTFVITVDSVTEPRTAVILVRHVTARAAQSPACAVV
jgi:hypothetical protein